MNNATYKSSIWPLENCFIFGRQSRQSPCFENDMKTSQSNMYKLEPIFSFSFIVETI